MWRHAKTGSAIQDDANVWLERTSVETPRLLPYRTMQISTGFNNHPQFEVLPFLLLSLTLLRSYFGSGVGRPMTVNLNNSHQGNRTLMWSHARIGSASQDETNVWPERTSQLSIETN